MDYKNSGNLIFNAGNIQTGLGGNQSLFQSKMQGGAHGYGFDGKSVAPGMADYSRINTADVQSGGKRRRNKSKKNKNRKSRKNRISRRRYV